MPRAVEAAAEAAASLIWPCLLDAQVAASTEAGRAAAVRAAEGAAAAGNAEAEDFETWYRRATSS